MKAAMVKKMVSILASAISSSLRYTTGARLRGAWLAVALTFGAPAVAVETYQDPESFIAETFSGKSPEPEVVWLTGERKSAVKALLGHDYASLRIRYWRDNARSAWILEEIGKEQPITAGIVIDDQQIERIKVLVFRESRGWEIRHPFFTDQFRDVRLDSDRKLDRHIDSISGATLSVRAIQKLARLALYLDAETGVDRVQKSP